MRVSVKDRNMNRYVEILRCVDTDGLGETRSISINATRQLFRRPAQASAFLLDSVPAAAAPPFLPDLISQVRQSI